MILAALALLATDIRAPTSTLRVTILPGMPIHLTTVVPLDSRSVKQGQRFELRVSEDVLVESTVVIPRGSPAVGEIEAVSGKGMVGKAGRLVLAPLFIDVGGERVNLTGISVERGKDSTAGVAVGSILLSGWGMFISGKSASVPAGATVDGRTRTAVSLVLPQPSASQDERSADRP